MKKIAILIDLELTKTSGGHVKFWERICNAIKNEKLDFYLELFFLGKWKRKIRVSKFITINIIKPTLPSKILKFIGIDADTTDLFPFNFSLFLYLKKFDLIHTTDQLFSMSRTARAASKVWKKPLTSSYHTDAPSYTEYYLTKIFNKLPKFLKSFLFLYLKLPQKISSNQKKRIKKYFNDCKKVIIGNEYMNDKLFFEEKTKKVYELRRGIDKKIFKKKEVDKDSLLKEHKIKNNFIIFFCGRIHELKGALFLSEIHKIIKQKGFDISTILAGENIHGKLCKKIAGDGLHIINYLDETEIASFMNICDLFVFPSLYETGPQVIIEAKSCKALCIVSPNGGGKKINKNGVDGIIVEKFTLEDWSDQILRLIKEKKKINKIKNFLCQNDNQESWIDIYHSCFSEHWKKLIGFK